MPGPRQPDPSPWWLWGRILSLDAPAVSCAWQGLFARGLGQRVQPHQAWLLGLSVWLAYTADRWIEGWSLGAETEARTYRHRFAIRYCWPLFAVWLLVLVAGLVLAGLSLSAREWAGSVALLLVVAAYLLSHQWLHRHKSWRPPKELCVAGIITGGAALYPVLQGEVASNLWRLAWPLFLFGLLALVNCLIIAEREREIDVEHGSESLALRVPWLHRVARGLPWLLTWVCLLLAALQEQTSQTALFVAAAGMALLLGVVAWLSPRLHFSLPGVLADAALLFPPLVLLALT